MSHEPYRTLRHLFGGYLHQDWSDEFSTPEAAVAAFRDAEPAEIVQQACDELDEALAEASQHSVPERFLSDVLWCYYRPAADGLTVREWLERVRQTLGCR